MKVKSKLQINAIISFSIISLIILMVLLIHQQEEKALSKSELAGEIVKGTFELNILTTDLLVHNEERAQEQWKLKYNSLNKLLTETEFESRETQDALDNMQEHFEKIKFAFNKLVDIKQKRRVLSHDKFIISQELEERLISQMSMNSQSMVTHAYQLDKASMREVEISMRREGLLTLSFVVVIVISVGVTFFLFHKQIVKPIGKLQKGIHAVAGGNLDHKVGISSNDEIGQLSTDFDLMTEKLKTITVSKDKLAKEIAIRKQTEDRNKSLAHILEESLNEIYIFDAKTLRFIQVNKGARLNLGYSMEDLSNLTPLDLKPELTDESFEKMVEPLRVGERQIIQFTTVHRRKDGSLYDVEVHLQLSTLQSVSVFVAIILDITERKQAEEEIKSQARFPSENPNPVLRVEKNGTIIFANNAGSTILDYWGTQTGQSVPEDWHQYALDVLRSGKSNDYEMKCDDRIFFLTLAPVVEEGYVNFYGRNITERMRAEEQIKKLNKTLERRVAERTAELAKANEELLKMQKLESVGILAGGIAHDFNNYLQGILSNIAIAKSYTDSNDKIYFNLTESEKTVIQAKGLSQQLLTFAKGGEPIKKVVSAQKLIKESAKFALSGSNIRCELVLPDCDCFVEIDTGQINQVFNNIFINAGHSMPEGGTIKVSAVHYNAEKNDLLPLQEGKYVKITIKDQGSGISQEHLQKIFDPYFTTKETGNGLGLATSFSIIKKHDGYITAESELGVGTTFYIYLPALQEEISKERVEGVVDKISTEEITSLDGRRILFMEDDGIIRLSVARQLRGLKYEVEYTKDGNETIKLYKKAMESDKPFDAVIMDLTIPGGMGGAETIKKLLEIDPDVAAIVASGYSDDPIMTNASEYGFKGVVEKPYEIYELEEVLQKVIMEKE